MLTCSWVYYYWVCVNQPLNGVNHFRVIGIVHDYPGTKQTIHMVAVDFDVKDIAYSASVSNRLDGDFACERL